MDNEKQAQENSTQPATMITLAEYAQKDCEKDICAMSTGIKTGFSNLDAHLSIMPGIYVLGAMPGSGKTTFAQQLGEQIAASGKPVIYYTLEQRKIDFLLKSLSRESFVVNPKDAVSAQNLCFGVADNDTYITERFDDLCKRYTDKELKFYIMESAFGLNVSALVGNIEQCIKQLSDLPVVVVDYLQIISVDGANTSQRDAVDRIIEQLKRLQQQYKLTIILISSISRSNYTESLSIDSFKESGKIEYTADVILGMQYSVVHNSRFTNENISQKRDAIAAEASKTDRNVELVCLKNRFGNTFTCSFTYHCAYNYFEPSNGKF